MTRTEYDYLKSTIETIEKVFYNYCNSDKYCNSDITSDTDYHKGFNLGQYGGLETAMNIVDSCFKKDSDYHKWLKEHGKHDRSKHARYYFIITMRNKIGDEKIIGCSDSESSAKQFCSTFDESKIPDGYKIGYVAAKEVMLGE